MAIRPLLRLLLACMFVSGAALCAQGLPRLLLHTPVAAPPSECLLEPPAAPRAPSAHARVSSLHAPALGQAQNPFSTWAPEANCVHANDSTGLVVFIHRNHPGLFGGTSGWLRYDISTDRGLTWATEVGPLNTAYPNARHPSVAAYDPIGNTDPLAGRLVYMGDDFINSYWENYVVGTAAVATSGTPATYDISYLSGNHTAASTMCVGRRGEYWRASFDAQLNDPTDVLRIHKGIYAPGTQTIAWNTADTIHFPWYYGLSGAPYMTSLVMAFSPDGAVGWIAGLGDLVGGQDSTYSPFLVRSTDGGTTWGNPVEVNLNAFPWVQDSLRSLWVDSSGQPVSAGVANVGFQTDLTVDMNGNPHLLFALGSLAGAPYGFAEGTAKYMVDLSSNDLGQSFTLRTVAPAYTFRQGASGIPEVYNPLLYPQVSRTMDGSRIFYTWRDSDSAVVGFGVPWNDAPDLWAAGLRVADGYTTCVIPITRGDSVWGGHVSLVQCAPTVLTSGSGPGTTYQLPTVSGYFNFQTWAEPLDYAYLGLATTLDESMFSNAPGGPGSWPGCWLTTGVSPAQVTQPWASVFPNPVEDRLGVQLRAAEEAPWSLIIVDLQGRTVAALQSVSGATGQVDLGGLPAGAYLYRITGHSGVTQAGKLLVR